MDSSLLMAIRDKDVKSIYSEILLPLSEKSVLADTRVRSHTLYEHLSLTAGLAVAILKELFLRGKSSFEICGETISEDKLVSVTRIAGLLHDWGKDDEQGYKDHLNRSRARVIDLVNRRKELQPYAKLIVNAVSSHHISCNPKTLLDKIICLSDYLASGLDRLDLLRADSVSDITTVNERFFNLYQNIFEDRDGLCLIYGDVDKIKGYVYESSDLPSIRGASEILNEINLNRIPEIFEEKLSVESLIYYGGGSFLAFSPVSLADIIISEIQNCYLKESEIVTITCIKSRPLHFYNLIYGLKPYSYDKFSELNSIGIARRLLESHFGKLESLNKDTWIRNKGFGELVYSITAELRLRKNMKDSIPFFEAPPVGRRCQLCGKRLATDSIEGDLFICNICKLKREKQRDKKLIFYKRFIDSLELDVDKAELFISKMPSTLDDIGRKSGYISYIYADGNDIGSLLARARSPSNYKSISTSINETVIASVYNALVNTFGGKDELINLVQSDSECIPFEIVNIGGDDVSLFISSSFMFDFVLNFLESFDAQIKGLEEKLNLKPSEKITMAVGAVISKPKFPVYFVEKLAESLLKSAKKTAKRKIESSLSFLYLTSSVGVESSDDLINSLYFNREKSVKLTMRPFTLSELKLLRKTGEQFKNIFKSTQRNILKQVLWNGRLQSINFLLYQIARLDEEKRAAVKQILNGLNSKFDCDSFCWRKDMEDNGKNIVYKTPLMDMLEMIDIIGEKGNV